MAAYKANRGRLGVTLIEMLIAMTFFCILLIPVFPALSQASRSAAYARDGYAAHLHAQEIMLIVKDAVIANQPHKELVEAYVNSFDESFAYGYWVNNISHISSGAPYIQVSLSNNKGMIMVAAAVFDDAGNIAGRALGMVNINE